MLDSVAISQGTRGCAEPACGLGWNSLSLQLSLPHFDTLPWLLPLLLVCHLDQKAVDTRGLVGSHLPQLAIVGQCLLIILSGNDSNRILLVILKAKIYSILNPHIVLALSRWICLITVSGGSRPG